MKQVSLPDGSIGEFPDDMDDAAIEQVLQREYPPTKAPSPLQQPGGLREQAALTALNPESAVPAGLVAPALAIGRGVAQIPAALMEATGAKDVLENIGKLYSGVGSMAAGGAGYRGTVQDMPYRRPAGEQAIYEAGRAQGPAEKALQQQYPISSNLAEALPPMAASFAAGRGATIPATLAGRAGAAGIESVGSGALVQGEQGTTFTDRLKQASTDFLGGAVFQAGLDKLVSPLISKVGKYIPTTLKAAEARAVAELNKWVDLTPAQLERNIKKTKEVFGDDAHLFGVQDMVSPTDAVALKNIESAFVAEAGPETAKTAMKRRAMQEDALNSALEDLEKTLTLSADEKEYAKAVYSKLAQTHIDPGAYEDLVSNPKLRDILTDIYGKQVPATGPIGAVDPNKGTKMQRDLRRKLEGFPRSSVAFWDTMKREVDRLRFDGKQPSAASEEALKELSIRIKAATDSAGTGLPEYAVARSLSQRKIIGENIEQMLSNAPERRVGIGEYAPTTEGVRSQFSKARWNEIEQALSGSVDEKTRTQGLKNARLVRDLVMSLDKPGAYTQAGKSVAPNAQVGGVYSSAARALLNAGSGKYNKAIVEVMYNPQKYHDTLVRIEKGAKNATERRAALVEYLSALQNQIDAKSENARMQGETQ